MHFKFKYMILLIVLVFSSVSLVITEDYPASSTVINVSFARHVDFPIPMPVQDVYVVLNDSTPDFVYRADPMQSKDPLIIAKEAYATTNHTPHDPLMETSNPVGPFPKGEDLGFTLGDWLSATGGGTYAVTNGNATMDFSFHNLVPNGTYTVWWAGVTHLPKYKYVLAPAGAPDGSENAFQADEKGNGAFHVDLPALPAGTNETRTLIVVRYHSNSKVPGAKPGEYGKTAHVQLLYRMPLPETQTQTTATAKAAEKQPGLESVFAIMAILAMAYITSRKGG